MARIYFQALPCNSVALDIKRILIHVVNEAKRLYNKDKKDIAISIGLNPLTAQATLTKYMHHPDYHLPAALVEPVCEVCRDWTLMEYFERLAKDTKRRRRKLGSAA